MDQSTNRGQDLDKGKDDKSLPFLLIAQIRGEAAQFGKDASAFELHIEEKYRVKATCEWKEDKNEMFMSLLWEDLIQYLQDQKEYSSE